MALDGMFLSLLRKEISQKILNSRIEKVNQPAKDELCLSMRGMNGNYKLLLSARADTARVQITAKTPENPKRPPMLCMLFRKLIGNARLVNIRQNQFERILLFDFETFNELGDRVTYTLVAEIMGRHSNIILINSENKIIDSLKRIGLNKSSVRQILPGLIYKAPPAQNKIPIGDNYKEIVEKIINYPRDIVLYKAIAEICEGVSPILAREISHRSLKGCDGIISSLNNEDKQNLQKEMESLNILMTKNAPVPTVVYNEKTKPFDFCFMPILQYGSNYKTKEYPSLCELLDDFFCSRDQAERMKQKMSDFSKKVDSKIERIEKKICLQKNELLECDNKEEFKIKGDLLSSYMYTLKKGMKETQVVNFYDEDKKTVKIKLDPLLTPAENMQKYYKNYRRADTAQKELTRLIEQGERELDYLYSVYDSMKRAVTDKELTAIRQELAENGYLKRQNKKKEKPVVLQPIKYLSDDGFLILSGRNNVGNDKLTLKTSHKRDIWFHTQKIPGSHTVIMTNGNEVPNETLIQAAVIAATNSSAANSSKVPVDFTTIKNVKKPSGAKPGMVIYDNFKTAIVNPDFQLLERLLENAKKAEKEL